MNSVPPEGSLQCTHEEKNRYKNEIQKESEEKVHRRVDRRRRRIRGERGK